MDCIQDGIGWTRPIDDTTSTHQTQILPVRNTRENAQDISKCIEGIDATHKRVGKPFSLRGGVGKGVPIHLKREKPDL